MSADTLVQRLREYEHYSSIGDNLMRESASRIKQIENEVGAALNNNRLLTSALSESKIRITELESQVDSFARHLEFAVAQDVQIERLLKSAGDAHGDAGRLESQLAVVSKDAARYQSLRKAAVESKECDSFADFDKCFDSAIAEFYEDAKNV